MDGRLKTIEKGQRIMVGFQKSLVEGQKSLVESQRSLAEGQRLVIEHLDRMVVGLEALENRLSRFE